MKKEHAIIVLLLLFVLSLIHIIYLYRGPIKALKKEAIQLSADIDSLRKEGKVTSERTEEEKKKLQGKIRALQAGVKKREGNLKKLKDETASYQRKLTALKKEVALKEGRVKELTTREEIKSQVLANVKK